MSDNNFKVDSAAQTGSTLQGAPDRVILVPTGHGDNQTLSAVLKLDGGDDFPAAICEHEFGHHVGGSLVDRIQIMHDTADHLVTVVKTDEHITSRLAALKAAHSKGENTSQDDEELEAILGLLVDRSLQADFPTPFVCDHCVEQRKRFGLPSI